MRRSAKFVCVVGALAAALLGSGAWAATDAERIDALEKQVGQIEASRSIPKDEGLPLHGFFNVGAGIQSSGGPRGFSVGNLDFYLTPKIGDRIKALLELNFEVLPSGTFDTDLERGQIGYVFSDAATLWAGRFHSPWGYWNTAFHHGQQLQTSITRPRFLEFEDFGGIIPAHTVGLWTTGVMPAGDDKVTYDVFAGNSQRILLDGALTPGTGTLDPNLAAATNKKGAAGFNLGYVFSVGLKLGLHGFVATIDDNAPSPGPNSTRVRFGGGYFAYLENDWEIMGEYYGFSNVDLSGLSGTHHSSAGYVQVGKLLGRWTPYVRGEKASLDQTDQYFAQQLNGGSYERGVAGLRYDLDPRACLKLEINNTRLTDRVVTNFSEVLLQWAIRF